VVQEPSFSISAGGASFTVSLEGNRLIRNDAGAFALRKRRVEIPVEAIEGYCIEPGRAPTVLSPWGLKPGRLGARGLLGGTRESQFSGKTRTWQGCLRNLNVGRVPMRIFSDCPLRML
jgi:hypothetical protein